MWVSNDKNDYFIKTTYPRLIHHIVLLVFSISGGVLGGLFPESFSLIGSNIFDNYLILKGLSFLLYSLITPIDEQKLYDLTKTQNYEKLNEMVGSLGLVYPVIFCSILIIILLLEISFYLYIKKTEENAKNEKKNKENELPTKTPDEKEEENIETPYYEIKN